MGNPKRYSKEFQERAVRRMKLGENVSQLARDLGVDRTCLYAWKRKLGRGPYHHGRTTEADCALRENIPHDIEIAIIGHTIDNSTASKIAAKLRRTQADICILRLTELQMSSDPVFDAVCGIELGPEVFLKRVVKLASEMKTAAKGDED